MSDIDWTTVSKVRCKIFLFYFSFHSISTVNGINGRNIIFTHMLKTKNILQTQNDPHSSLLFEIPELIVF